MLPFTRFTPTISLYVTPENPVTATPIAAWQESATRTAGVTSGKLDLFLRFSVFQVPSNTALANPPCGPALGLPNAKVEADNPISDLAKIATEGLERLHFAIDASKLCKSSAPRAATMIIVSHGSENLRLLCDLGLIAEILDRYEASVGRRAEFQTEFKDVRGAQSL